MNKLTTTLEAQKITYRDCEEFFQRERDIVQKSSTALEQFCLCFDKIIFAQISKLLRLLIYFISVPPFGT